MSKRDYGVGRYAECGAVLLPTDYFHCVECYRTLKATKRRYRREVADRQLQTLLARVKEVDADPWRFHWLPDSVILFGSMLKKDGLSVGDIDLCTLGSSTHRYGMEPWDEHLKWNLRQRPRKSYYGDQRQWGEIAAISYIRKHPNIVILAPMGDFSNIGSGRPFPYEILWTRDAHITPEALRAEIETQRPLHLQASLREREETIKRYPVIT